MLWAKGAHVPSYPGCSLAYMCEEGTPTLCVIRVGSSLDTPRVPLRWDTQLSSLRVTDTHSPSDLIVHTPLNVASRPHRL